MMKLAVLIAAQLNGVLALSTNFRQENILERDLLLDEQVGVSTTILSIDVPLPTGVGVEVGQPRVQEVFPVPTASRCVVIILVTYMSVLAALAITRAYHDITETERGRFETALKDAFSTLTYGPMVCVLFIAYRMRVEFLSYGLDNPQIWAQVCMYCVTFAVVGNAFSVLLIPALSGKPAAITEETPRVLSPASGIENKAVRITVSCLSHLIMALLFGGLAGVLIGMMTYTPPHESDIFKVPAPAPAVMCTMIITGIFFITWLIIGVLRSLHEFTGIDTAAFEHMANGAASIIEYGPMLCILFLAARMRALQHGSQPQEWSQFCMFVATGSLGITAMLAILVPLMHGGEMTVDENTHDAKLTVDTRNRIIGITMVVVRYATMIGFYGGAAGVAVSIFLFQAPDGPKYTRPISPTVECVMILTSLFFAIYLAQIIMMTASELSEGKYPMEKYSFFGALDAAKSNVQFAPVLAILFVTTRMYALLITSKEGAPQHWVQDAMYIATWSLVISTVSCLAVGIAKGKVEQDEDGHVVNKFENKALAVTMINIRALCLIMFYGGCVATVIGLFAMTPETANGRGRVPVISEAVEVVKGKRFLF